MSVPKQCCNPCPDVLVENVPGPEGTPGEPGTNGTNGINAFTLTTADFIVPIIGGNVTVSVGNSTWAVPGQKIFVQGAGYFDCVSKPTPDSIILTYLNYAGNTNTGNTISAGAGVSPGGNQGPNATLLPTQSSYAVGGSQALTNSSVQLLSLSVVLPTTGHYLLIATLRLDFVAATFSSAEAVALKLRETVNGPADIANAVVNANTGTRTLISETFGVFAFPPVDYNAQSGDTVQLFGSVAASPYSGALQAIEGSILAIPLF
jgi:hypothetical protein